MKKIGGYRTFLAITVLAAGVCSTAFATTLVPMGMGELSLLAQEVLTGKVLMTRTEKDSMGRIVTHVTIAVEQYFKSGLPILEAPPFLTVEVPSGVKGSERTVLLSGPVFLEGERVVVFLHPDSEGELQVVGLGQGKFSIRESAPNKAHVIGRLGRPDGEWEQLRDGRVRMDFDRFSTRLGALAQMEEIRRLEVDSAE